MNLDSDSDPKPYLENVDSPLHLSLPILNGFRFNMVLFEALETRLISIESSDDLSHQ